MAQVYPMEFIEAVLRATKKQLEWDARGLYLLGAVEKDDDQEAGETVPEEEDELRFAVSWDDLTGELLDPKLVRDARKEEI